MSERITLDGPDRLIYIWDDLKETYGITRLYFAGERLTHEAARAAREKIPALPHVMLGGVRTYGNYVAIQWALDGVPETYEEISAKYDRIHGELVDPAAQILAEALGWEEYDTRILPVREDVLRKAEQLDAEWHIGVDPV